MQKMIIANWKMQGQRSDLEALKNCLPCLKACWEKLGVYVLICPPFPYIPFVHDIVASTLGVSVGAQTCASGSDVRRTGEVSAEMLVNLGCTHVLIGHAERRALNAETPKIIVNQVKHALINNLHPIMCVSGENDEVIRHIDALDDDRISIAYEPIDAIGSVAHGVRVVLPVMRHLKHRFPRQKILYGGGVQIENIAEFFALGHGVLIGGMSLKWQNFEHALSLLCKI